MEQSWVGVGFRYFFKVCTVFGYQTLISRYRYRFRFFAARATSLYVGLFLVLLSSQHTNIKVTLNKRFSLCWYNVNIERKIYVILPIDITLILRLHWNVEKNPLSTSSETLRHSYILQIVTLLVVWVHTKSVGRKYCKARIFSKLTNLVK